MADSTLNQLIIENKVTAKHHQT